MCMIEDADGRCVVLHDDMRRARKSHSCYECGRTIEPGETYNNKGVVLHQDGRTERKTYKTCAHCCVCCEWLRKQCGGYLFGGVWDDILEHVNEGYGRKLRGLNNLLWGLRAHWRLSNGTLMKVPRLPEVTA